jgi:endonuclease/exonuclease/phosphatase family metal-dependent hydrolase
VPAFPKPDFDHPFTVQSERRALRRYRNTEPGRAIPRRNNQNLLLASWNIANLGAQARTPAHAALIAEVISWFDLVAIQEVRDDLSGLRDVLAELSGAWRTVFTDMAGNDERMAYLYRYPKVKLTEMCGELAIPVADHRNIKLPGVTRSFTGFDRNPMIASFDVRGFRLGAVNVHLYFGSQRTSAHRRASMERRQLEAYAVARWCDLRRRDVHRYVDHFVALGDFNLPKWADAKDPIRKALTKRGLRRPDHSARIASAIASDSDYDQILVVPGLVSRVKSAGVFDYDGGIFPGLFQTRTEKQFNAYLRYYISDHRPIWSEIDIR